MQNWYSNSTSTILEKPIDQQINLGMPKQLEKTIQYLQRTGSMQPEQLCRICMTRKQP